MDKVNVAKDSPQAPEPPGKKYGLTFNDPGVTELMVELLMFRWNLPPEKGGLGKYQHFRNVAKLMWPLLEWNPWLERQIRSLCEYQVVVWAGCAAASKTFASALYGMIFWAAYPTESSVVLCSTSRLMIRKRVWSEITSFRLKFPGFPGVPIDSKTQITATPGDDKHGIFAMPVKEGSVTKACANIQGVHGKRILLVIDEATDTPRAVFDVESNMRTACAEFQMLVIGNPNSRFDCHGRLSEPKDPRGWNSVDINTEEWETKRGICVRFDATKSPNVKAGKDIYPYLYRISDLRNAEKNEGVNDPLFWKFARGYWAPDGVNLSVVSDAMFVKFKAEQPFTFTSESLMLGALDPSRGGDRCILRFAKMGDKPDGKKVILFGDIVHIKLDAEDPNPIAYQIAKQVRAECQNRNCRPENFAMDNSGDGSSIADVITMEWSDRITRIEFGGAASDAPCSDYDNQPAHDVYYDRVTELWYGVRDAVKAGQVRGLDIDTMQEFEARLVSIEKRKRAVESKVDMKDRVGMSPDLADAAAIIIELAKQKGFRDIPVSADGSSWESIVQDQNSLYKDLYVG